jgi:hypothetical protein
MGEAADDAIDRGMEEWLSGEWDDEGYYFAREKTCRRCHERNLWWSCHDGRYQLVDEAGKVHVCLVPAAKDVFK